MRYDPSLAQRVTGKLTRRPSQASTTPVEPYHMWLEGAVKEPIAAMLCMQPSTNMLSAPCHHQAGSGSDESDNVHEQCAADSASPDHVVQLTSRKALQLGTTASPSTSCPCPHTCTMQQPGVHCGMGPASSCTFATRLVPSCMDHIRACRLSARSKAATWLGASDCGCPKLGEQSADLFVAVVGVARESAAVRSLISPHCPPAYAHVLDAVRIKVRSCEVGTDEA